jgi:putative transposase
MLVPYTISNTQLENIPFFLSLSSNSLGRLIGAFKTVSTKQINLIRDTSGTPVWQRNYYEHIIRDDATLQFIRQYIHNNPCSWQQDQLHPDHPSR